MVIEAPDRSCNITDLGFICYHAHSEVQCCQGARKLPNPFARRLGGRGKQEKKQGSRRGGAVPADPSADLLLGHSKENIYMSVGGKLTYKCEFLDVIGESDK